MTSKQVLGVVKLLEHCLVAHVGNWLVDSQNKRLVVEWDTTCNSDFSIRIEMPYPEYMDSNQLETDLAKFRGALPPKHIQRMYLVAWSLIPLMPDLVVSNEDWDESTKTYRTVAILDAECLIQLKNNTTMEV